MLKQLILHKNLGNVYCKCNIDDRAVMHNNYYMYHFPQHTHCSKCWLIVLLCSMYVSFPPCDGTVCTYPILNVLGYMCCSPNNILNQNNNKRKA